MEEKVPNFRVQFCKSIELAVERNFCNLRILLQIDLQLYDDSEKIECIHPKRNEIRNFLEGSDYKKYFPVKDIETNLNHCLNRYYDMNLIYLASGNDFIKSHKKGKYVLSHINKVLTIYSSRWLHGKEQDFDFSRFKEFEFMIQYIALGKLFIELNRLEAELKNEKIINTADKLPEMIHPAEKLNEDCQTVCEPSNQTKRPAIFKEGAYELFCYLKTEYIKDEKFSKAKYSNIYHFFKYNELITDTQLAYIDFIDSEMNVNLSKILSEKKKYFDTVFPLLSCLKSEFDKMKRIELKKQ